MKVVSIQFRFVGNSLGTWVYLVSFDRPGYGQSDLHPKQTMKSIAYNMEELADQLGLGFKFFVIGLSMGGPIACSCLKYIPNRSIRFADRFNIRVTGSTASLTGFDRVLTKTGLVGNRTVSSTDCRFDFFDRLAGAALIAPVVNYWSPGFPANLSKEAYCKQFAQDQWAIRVARYTPRLPYWWNTRKRFPSFSVISGNPKLSPQDVKLMSSLFMASCLDDQENPKQQGEFESVHRDLMVAFGNWEFDPMDLDNPFVDNESSVHLWHGDEDGFVPVSLQRYIAARLS
ncbi:alpha/beta-Hydrolases superfamily protein [Actinidia rufa]|uniref:Alpha/beta-Hydrolases superfamily protein n=1 Tax=Actinidia rufa TaxID=165716 RepID=A0A7J0GV57_9ERIC|nr:alpha/beta-Hydrolases superfamily protein [Actinidia rufa]